MTHVPEILAVSPERNLLKTLNYVFIVFLIFIFSGCSKFNGTRFEGLLGGDQDLIQLAYKMADDLERQAFPPLIPRHPDQPILTTTFVSNDNFNETSRFSRIMQEHLTSRFVQLGYTVREVKLRNELRVQPQSGETILSRNLNDIKSDQKAQAISVGTYSIANRNMYISARMINPVTSNIISSVDYKIVMGKNMLAMFGLQLKPDDDILYIDEPRPSLMTRILY